MVIVVACLGAPAFADVTNGVRYAVPSGWVGVDKDNVRVVAPPPQPGELMAAVIVGAQAATGSPDEQLGALASALNSDAKVRGSSDVSITDRGAVGKLYAKSYDVESADHGVHVRMIGLLLRGDQRAVIVLLFTSNTVLQKHGAGVQELLKSVAIVAPPGTPTPTPPPTTDDGTHLPTGNTPDLYFGSVGWMPSGRGVKIPTTRIANGKPEGMWWRYTSGGMNGNQMIPLLMVYLPDGTHAVNPRFGSGALYDVDGQRAQHGSTGVGTFTIKDGKISETTDGYTHENPFKSGTDKDGPWFEIGAGRHYPLELVAAKDLVGRWKSPSGKFVFNANGTYESGNVIINREVTVAQGSQGRWQADGYLLAIRPGQAREYITSVGRTGKFLIIGTTVYAREE